MKILHFADVHFDQQNADLALASLAVVEETGRRESVDAFTLAGDLFNRGIQNSATARLPDLIAAIGRLLDIAPVVAVEGTNTHDVAGCYAPLQAIGGRKHRFHLLPPGGSLQIAGALFFGLPEPSKTWLLAGQNGMSAEEAAEAVKLALRRILLGMGAVRAEHPEIPAVLVYHGAVEGATLANGQLLEGGLALGRDDLALVGADYVAMGHIHLRQQIPGIPAWYAGSAFPVTWGELDQKSCNLVEIDPTIIDAGPVPDRANVTAVPFPHAPRRKVTVDLTGPFEGLLSIAPQLGEIRDHDVWLVLRTRNGDGATLAGGIREMMIDAGALPGSRVTVETIPTETVRAAEITERHHLREKVAVYAEASGEAAPAETVLAKADALEHEAVAAGADAGAHLRIRKLRLRGATGIWKGLGLDEITLDLDRYDAGLVALVGPNGAGKSTLLENMHPWPQLLTRDGKMQDHFRLRDSARELWFVDERTGAEYRALMLIDGQNATGKAEYHLFRGGEPLTNGRKEDYEAAVEKLFGTLALFLRSAFVSQRATKTNPDLAEATKGEKKAIFRELAGLDWLQAAAEKAKSVADTLEHQVEIDQAKTAAQAQQLEALPELLETLAKTADDLVARELELVKVEERGKAAGAFLKDIEAEKVAQAATERAIAETVERQRGYEAAAVKAAREIDTLRAALQGRAAAEAGLADYEALREEERKENERAKQHAELDARAQSEYAGALRAHRDHDAEIQKRHAAAQKAMVTLEGDRRVVLGQIDRLIADIATPEKACPQCGYTDPERETMREGWHTALVAAQEKAHGLAQDIEGKRREAEAIEAERAAPPEAPTLPAFDGAPLAALKAKLARIDAVVLRAIVDTAKDAAARIDGLEKVAEDAKQKAIETAERIEALRGQIDATLAPRAAAAQAAYDEARREYQAANEQRAGLAEKVKMHRARIAELEAIAEQIAEARQRAEQQRAEAAEWRWLQTACGPDGVQALELDALGPGIAEVANRLLSAAYGTRFAVEFRTTRIAGRGSRVKQVEDFQVIITDNEDGTEQELSTLSGGESVWLKNAIYAAFGIVRDLSTGIRFLTCFLDEMDGALDPEARLHYFQMLNAMHHEGGRRHTLVVTHSEAAQEMIAQKIIMQEMTKQEVQA